MWQWDYPSRSSDDTYTVTQGDSGVLACTCRGCGIAAGPLDKVCQSFQKHHFGSVEVDSSRGGGEGRLECHRAAVRSKTK